MLVLVTASSAQCGAWVITFRCFDGTLLHGGFSSNQHSWVFLVASRYETAPGILCLVASGIGCPLPIFVLVGLFSLTTVSAMKVSDCSGVDSCSCPISFNMILLYTNSLTMMYSATSLSSVANDIICLMMCEMLSIVPLFYEMEKLLDKNKCPTAWLCDFFC